MKHLLSLTLLFFFTTVAWGNNDKAVAEESLFNHYQSDILIRNTYKSQTMAPGLTSFEQKLFVDALEDLISEGSSEAVSVLNKLKAPLYDIVEKLRLEVFKIRHGQTSFLPKALVSEIINELQKPEVDIRLIYILAVYEDELIGAGHLPLIKLAQEHPEYSHLEQDRDAIREAGPEVLSDLFYRSPDLTTYMNGEYIQGLKIFMFCRYNRIYPCLMVMRGITGEAIRLPDGNLWSHSALGSSKLGLPSYTRNGNTPAGIMTMDSVMPLADQQITFGRNRRVILNFIPKSSDEVLAKRLLPESSHKHEWWKPAMVSRDIGRNLLRIHGTGKLNNDPFAPYYPFMRTSGCIAQKENSYDGTYYNDQRVLLDKIMEALELTPELKNEVKIKGVIYLVDINDESRSVELEDLHALGIK